MKKVLLLISVMLLALGTAFAQEASNEVWETSYDAESQTLTVTCTATLINGNDAATGVVDLVGTIWKDAVGAGQNLNAQASNNGFTLTATVSGVEENTPMTFIARWEWAGGGIYQAPDYKYGESGEGEVPEPSEPIVPTAESFTVGEAVMVYDAGAQSLKMTCSIATAENAGFEWSQITGPVVNFIINNGTDGDILQTAVANGTEFTATFSAVEAGKEIVYKVNIVTGSNAIVAGSNVSIENPSWVYTPEASGSDPEPVIERWTMTGAVPFFFGGGDWEFYAENDMIKSDEWENTWVKEFLNIDISEEQLGQTYEYKLGANGGYDVDKFPTSDNLKFQMPSEAGLYNVIFYFDDGEQRNVQISCNPVHPKGPDALYIRGNDFGGWNDDVSDPALIDNKWLAATSDRLIYLWDWSDEPVLITQMFKFGRLLTEAEVEAGQPAWSQIINGAYGSVYGDAEIGGIGEYGIETPGNNFYVPGDPILVSKIELDLIKKTVNFMYEGPTAIDETNDIAVSASNGRISVDGEFTIVNLAGQEVTAQNGNLQGVYIVVVADQTIKVNVQ